MTTSTTTKKGIIKSLIFLSVFQYDTGWRQSKFVTYWSNTLEFKIFNNFETIFFNLSASALPTKAQQKTSPHTSRTPTTRKKISSTKSSTTTTITTTTKPPTTTTTTKSPTTTVASTAKLNMRLFSKDIQLPRWVE